MLQVKWLEYVDRGAGAGRRRRRRILARAVLPNVVGPHHRAPPALGLATAVLDAAGLSFLGLGAQPPTPEWGPMLSQGRELILDAPWALTAPGLAILFSVLGFNLLGDGAARPARSAGVRSRALAGIESACYDRAVTSIVAAQWASVGAAVLPALFVFGAVLMGGGEAGAADPPPSRSGTENEPRLGGDISMQQFLKGILAETRGDVRGSAEALRHAYLVDPDSPTLLRVLSRAALHAGDTETAIRFATRGIEIEPHNPRLRFLRASIYQALGQDETALSDLEAASNATRATATTRSRWRGSMSALNRLEAAREAYERAFRPASRTPTTRCGSPSSSGGLAAPRRRCRSSTACARSIPIRRGWR